MPADGPRSGSQAGTGTRVLRRLGAVLSCIVAVAVVAPVGAASASPTTFGDGSLVIPMDIGASGQDNGMLRAYGLVYRLLQGGVPVHWAIDPAKPAGGTDFTIATGSVKRLDDASAVSLPRPYRGGPFVVRSSDRAAALPIIQAWQATAGDATAVHDVVAGTFTVEVARTLVAAPRIGILRDGFEAVALNGLNAAGIPDSTGMQWSASSPDVLTEEDVAGPTPSSDDDGALFDGQGLTRYCQLLAMHYDASSATGEVVQEARSWLDAGSLTHAFMQCEAVSVFENAASGRFLTTQGLRDDGSALGGLAFRFPSSPLSQIDGPFTTDVGTLDSIALAPGSAFREGVRTLINEQSSPVESRIALLSGHLDGSDENGRVTYLAGHDYSLGLPISSNPQTNGVRVLLNGIFEALCAAALVQPDVTLVLAAPAETTAPTVTYTLTYSNPGSRPVDNLTLVNRLPPGTTFEGANGGGTHAGGVVTWKLGTLAPDTGGSVQMTVRPGAHGTYRNQATAEFAHLALRKVTSNETATIVRTGRLEVPGAVDFGAQATSTVGPVRTVLVRNPAPAATGDSVAVRRLRLIGGDFLIATDDCSGAVLGGSESCAVGLRFAPGEQGERTGSLSVDSDAVDGPHSTALRGVGGPAPGLVGPSGDTGPVGPAGPPGTTAAIDQAAPRVTLSVAPARLGVVRRRGLRILATCSEACDLAAALSTGRRTARALGLARTRIGRTVGSRAAAGALRMTLRLTPRAVRRLARARRLRATLTVIATDPAGNAATQARKLLFRR